jgi:hypothetical protein
MEVSDKYIARAMGYAALLIRKNLYPTNPAALAAAVIPLIGCSSHRRFVYRLMSYKPVIAKLD